MLKPPCYYNQANAVISLVIVLYFLYLYLYLLIFSKACLLLCSSVSLSYFFLSAFNITANIFPFSL